MCSPDSVLLVAMQAQRSAEVQMTIDALVALRFFSRGKSRKLDFARANEISFWGIRPPGS